jgi:hypothetical protein
MKVTGKFKNGEIPKMEMAFRFSYNIELNESDNDHFVWHSDGLIPLHKSIMEALHYYGLRSEMVRVYIGGRRRDGSKSINIDFRTIEVDVRVPVVETDSPRRIQDIVQRMIDPVILAFQA